MSRTQCWLFLASLVLLQACSQTPSQAQLQRLDYRSQLDQSERQYFVYLPPGYQESEKTWPVMLFLHGDGERGNGQDELDYVLRHGPLYEAWIQKQDLPFIIISPQLPMFGRDETVGYLKDRDTETIPQRLSSGVPPRIQPGSPPVPMNGDLKPDSMDVVPVTLPNGWDRVEEDLLTMLDTVQAQFRTDPERVYLTGLSYGGFGTWYLASQHPDRFAAIAPVVGWGHPDLVGPIAEAQLPVWAFAGGRDPVVQVRHFYPGLNALEQAGHEALRFTTHEDMGHDTWLRVYQSQDLYQWLLRHRNNR